MRPDTIQRLNALNRRFYADRATSFDDARQQGWPGFAQVIERWRRSGRKRMSVLDLGCGNGRFGEYLLRHWPAPVHYTGVDQSSALLALARQRLRRFDGVTLRRLDLIEGTLGGLRRYDGVVAFGLMHHVPGYVTRQRLLRWAVTALAPGGTLAVTFWRFSDRPRFRRKLVAWTAPHPFITPGLDVGDLEPGDHLLRWGKEGDAVRYCHHPSRLEIGRLATSVTAALVDRFRTDGAGGDLNHYLIFERR